MGNVGADGIRKSKKSNGRELNGQIYNEYPELIAEYFE
jgi:protein gp37